MNVLDIEFSPCGESTTHFENKELGMDLCQQPQGFWEVTYGVYGRATGTGSGDTPDAALRALVADMRSQMLPLARLFAAADRP